MFLHILTSPIFVDSPRWSHEILELPLLLPTYLVLCLLMMLSTIYLSALHSNTWPSYEWTIAVVSNISPRRHA